MFCGCRFRLFLEHGEKKESYLKIIKTIQVGNPKPSAIDLEFNMY